MRFDGVKGRLFGGVEAALFTLGGGQQAAHVCHFGGALFPDCGDGHGMGFLEIAHLIGGQVGNKPMYNRACETLKGV
ncbi:hypothetical protein [Polaromonas eurypsychrophila]|uniref:hypothetical protein n=1 Tax=Polaromonas eurypsychrophila TaxID=1614635 RepID=UPI001E300F36|nr:hypothetical protein [Polaromonas eurypsychrophila]